jgi:predicted AAA+ superfamily ATPase
MISRLIQPKIEANLKKNKVVGLFGPRRSGKTFLMNHIYRQMSGKKVLMVNGENLDVAEVFSSQRLSVLEPFLEGYDYLFIDEAQKITRIGLNLKLIVDSIPGIRIFITGSAPLDLKEKIGEPLTGRSIYYHLLPIGQIELGESYSAAVKNLRVRLVYGMYPEVITKEKSEEKKDTLESIKNGYLLKDILMMDNQKDSIFILNLLRLVAFQIGKDVSYNELARSLGVSKITVMRYLDLLERMFVIFSLRGFSRNLRKEYSKTPRYYFWDNGIRNVIVSNFNRVERRDDIGMLWENLIISERLKRNELKSETSQHFFWRTYDKKEIDFIEEREGRLKGYEIKWGTGKWKKPDEFLKTYRNSEVKVINRENFLSFISK